MRGNRKLQNPMFFVANTEERLPKNHPRRADEVLKQKECAFEAAYSRTGRPGILPEALLKAPLLQALHSIAYERRLDGEPARAVPEHSRTIGADAGY